MRNKLLVAFALVATLAIGAMPVVGASASHAVRPAGPPPPYIPCSLTVNIQEATHTASDIAGTSVTSKVFGVFDSHVHTTFCNEADGQATATAGVTECNPAAWSYKLTFTLTTEESNSGSANLCGGTPLNISTLDYTVGDSIVVKMCASVAGDTNVCATWTTV